MAEADQGPVRWPPPLVPDDRVPMPGWGLALARGLAMRCPACGHAGVFRGFIDIKPVCPHCAAPLGRVRLELLPSYLTILLGLGVMGAVMIVSALLWRPGLVRFIAVFVPACILFELALVRPVRALTLAVMLKMNVLRPEGTTSDAG
ncbi:MAG TPA: DUF983 domain-containing protein [Acidocella sp.]|jgi:uncharacterized protein (DUF983 family)|uniref:DUF983 domain-containing protein n=1 Tax=Acidocella sp. TaxID=50710 RepID=UPI002CF2725F|nr:DUF983 domain-containing protein [Acidocella sp.]HVE23069.1 DUF983 domain-containing protein [Acidocella sp.]